MPVYFFFFFNDTATTEIYTLSLHDALPIYFGQRVALASSTPAGISRRLGCSFRYAGRSPRRRGSWCSRPAGKRDRKSTRLNSSHLVISYAVFCLKKKKHKMNSCTIDVKQRS